MSEERGKRDDSVSGSSDSGSADESVVSDQVDNGPVPAEESPVGAAPAGKPSGKRSARRGGASAVESGEKAKPAVAATSVKSPKARSGAKPAAQPRTENIFKRLRRFLREVVAELRKVIWPNRKQMVTYTSVVVVFVAFMVTFISLLDVGFIKGVSWLFG